MIKISKSILKH